MQTITFRDNTLIIKDNESGEETCITNAHELMIICELSSIKFNPRNLKAPVNKNILVESEDLTVTKQNTQNNTHNKGRGGARKGAGRKKGTKVPLSDDTKRKISAALKGNTNAKK